MERPINTASFGRFLAESFTLSCLRCSDDTTDQMRNVMLLNHISLEWLYGASTATLKPFSVVMGLVKGKGKSPMQCPHTLSSLSSRVAYN